jgi:hypothetical protein
VQSNNILSVPLEEDILDQTVPEEESKDVIEQKIASGGPIKKYILEGAWNSRAQLSRQLTGNECPCVLRT